MKLYSFCIPMLRDMSGAFCVPVENDQLRAGILGDQPVLRMESVERQYLFLYLGGAFAVFHLSQTSISMYFAIATSPS